MITDKYKIREQNEAKLLQTIINQQKISRAQLAEYTGLNKASVSSIIRDLLEDNLIIETGIGNASASGGRKPVWLKFNGKVATTLALDIGTDYLKGIFAYADGEIISELSLLKQHIDSKNIVQIILKAIQKLTTTTNDALPEIVGLTLAIHGQVVDNHILFTPNYDLDQENILTAIQEEVPYPIFLENEANLAALGEYTFTSESQELVCISIHSGIGAGIVEFGEIKDGFHGSAGEIGHTVLFPNGTPCRCGNKGCLERYASNSALYQAYLEATDVQEVDSDFLAQAFEQQDVLAKKLITQNMFYLSIGVHNLCMLLDPEVIVMNSPLFQKIPSLIHELQNHLTTSFSKKVRIRNSLLGDKATLMGGVALSLQNYLHIQNLKIVPTKENTYYL